MEGPKPKSHTIGPYEVEAELGRGGMSVVYRAKQATLDRMVALKVMHESFGLDSDYAARFRQEAITVARLEHPSIVPVYDAGQDGASLYLAMRLVPGETLAKLIQDFGPMPLDSAVVVLGQIAEALDYAHSQAVIHRDIKPGNVLVEPGYRANLADFGIARTGGSERLTRFGTLAGTPDYLAPEVISGAQATSASDRYALGVVAYEVLSGTVPFTGETDVAVLFGHVNEPIPPISKSRPDLPGYVDVALRMMLAKAPEDRFGTASAFVAALSGKNTVGRAPSGSLPVQFLDQVTSLVPGSLAAPQAPPSVAGTTVAGQAKRSVQSVKGGRSPYLVPGLSGLVAFSIVLVLANAQTGGRSGPIAMVAAMFASPTATPIPPTPTPTIEQRWVSTQAYLGAAWEKDWPSAISALEAFRKDYPDHDESKQKLYAALVSYGKLQVEGGDRRGAVAPWVKAQDLLPGRGEAQQLLVALTPTPTPIPTNTPMPTATPLPRILASDNFSPTSRRLVDDRIDPQGRYAGGRYQGSFVVVHNSNIDFLPVFVLGVTQNNGALSVLASIDTDYNGYVMLACRGEMVGDRQYRAWIDTDKQRASIGKGTQDLLTRTVPSIRKGTVPNRIKFACIGSQLSLTVNDTLVGSVSDSSYVSGRWWFASSNYSGQPSRQRTEFNDLVVTER